MQEKEVNITKMVSYLTNFFSHKKFFRTLTGDFPVLCHI